MSDQYILVGHEPVPEPDLETWARWLESADRHVKLTEQDDVRVSTVFLGLDHGWGEERPIVFETMVFIGGDGGEMDRYRTWDEAVAGHDRMVAKVFAARPILGAAQVTPQTRIYVSVAILLAVALVLLVYWIVS